MSYRVNCNGNRQMIDRVAARGTASLEAHAHPVLETTSISLVFRSAHLVFHSVLVAESLPTFSGSRKHYFNQLQPLLGCSGVLNTPSSTIYYPRLIPKDLVVLEYPKFGCEIECLIVFSGNCCKDKCKGWRLSSANPSAGYAMYSTSRYLGRI